MLHPCSFLKFDYPQTAADSGCFFDQVLPRLARIASPGTEEVHGSDANPTVNQVAWVQTESASSVRVNALSCHSGFLHQAASPVAWTYAIGSAAGNSSPGELSKTLDFLVCPVLAPLGSLCRTLQRSPGKSLGNCVASVSRWVIVTQEFLSRSEYD